MKNANQVQKNENNRVNTNLETVTCGNCWGHQEWAEGTIDKAEKAETSKDNFIQEVTKKVLK